jgi:hypothetical protein
MSSIRQHDIRAPFSKKQTLPVLTLQGGGSCRGVLKSHDISFFN